MTTPSTTTKEALEPPDRIYLPADTSADTWNILAKNPTHDWSTGEPANNIEYRRVSAPSVSAPSVAPVKEEIVRRIAIARTEKANAEKSGYDRDALRLDGAIGVLENLLEDIEIAAPASPAALRDEAHTSRSVLAEIETALLSINNGVSPQVAVGQVFAIINNERAGLGAAVAIRDEAAPCINCSHSDPHDGPAETVSDACTHEGCNCGYYQPATTPEDEVRRLFTCPLTDEERNDMNKAFDRLDSSTLARKAAEEIASWLFAKIFHPSRQGGISESQESEIAAIIERCFSAESES